MSDQIEFFFFFLDVRINLLDNKKNSFIWTYNKNYNKNLDLS